MPQQLRDTEDMDSILSSILHGSAPSEPAKQKVAKPLQATQPKAKRSSKGLFIGFFVIILLGSAAAGSFYYKDRILGLFTPPSPFKGIVSDVSYPLYYPTKLPEGFKIELNSIIRPEGSEAVAYKLSNDTGKQVFISLQAKPDELDLETLEAKYSEPRVITTPYGPVTIGLAQDNLEIANVLTDKTWVIVNAKDKTVSDEEFNQLIISLVEAK